MYKEKDLTEKEKNYLITQIELCDGIILQGGLSSHNYEIFIAKYAIEHNIPLLGICAGFNNIARALGTEVDCDKNLVDSHDIYSSECCHNVIIQDTAKVLKQLGNECFVNSIHSMTLNLETAKLNKRINLEAIVENNIDGKKKVTVEAFSVKDTKFCLAIKWHPELLKKEESTRIIFSEFVKACGKEIN